MPERSVPPLCHDGVIHLGSGQFLARTFLLGNQGGFVLYLPVSQNVPDRSLMPIKWFGASDFGRKYFEANLVFLRLPAAGAEPCGGLVKLDRAHQTGFSQYLDRAVRTFQVGEYAVTQSFFVTDQIHAFVMTVETQPSAEIIVEPEYDMRYYQAFNRDFSGYAAAVEPGPGAPSLLVSNRISGPPSLGILDFCSVVRPLHSARIDLFPAEQRLRDKAYLTDEEREKLIHTAYTETHVVVPDEAPIWDTYETRVYAPARLTAASPLTLIYAFGDRPGEAESGVQAVTHRLPELRRQKIALIEQRRTQAGFRSGQEQIDCAYTQVLTRFSEALVARDATIYAGKQVIKQYSAIFAGNKYFLDAWKRDENISLVGLLVTGEFETVRAILHDTWQHQDQRTGRLPHIIRLGEPLVYFSSDGTLWALRRLGQYTHMSGDQSLLDEKYPMVEHFFTASLSFVQRGLLPSGGIIDKSYLWETWEDTPYTPRNGYPVEIELLWLTALADYLPIIRARNPELAARLQAALAEGRQTFALFQVDGYLADSLSYTWQPRCSLTPNGYIAFGLGYPLPPALQRSMVLLARQELAGRVGIRSLAPRDWSHELAPAFLADHRNVEQGNMASVGIYNYHRGIEWLWLNQFFVEAELTCGDTDTAYGTYVNGQVHAALQESGVGGLGELNDLRGPLGADFQAWSMTSFLTSLRAFAGVQVDALARLVKVRPSIPQQWPELTCRYRVGSSRFDVSHRREVEKQVVTVQSVGDPPPGYRLCLGIRTTRPAVHDISMNGHPIDPRSWTWHPGCAPDVEGDLWVEGDFTAHNVAEFRGA